MRGTQGIGECYILRNVTKHSGKGLFIYLFIYLFIKIYLLLTFLLVYSIKYLYHTKNNMLI